MPRYRDPSRDVGNLDPGKTLLGEPIVDVLPAGRAYNWIDEAKRIGDYAFNHAYSAPAFRSPAYRQRSLRRF